MKWELGYSDTANVEPKEYIETEVPVDVQLVFKHDEKGDYNFGSNYLSYKWMEDKWWFFKTTIDVEIKSGYIPVLEFKGIDYKYTISINNSIVIDSEGMYTPVSICLSEYENSKIEVLVKLHPIPRKTGVKEGREEAALSCIPPVSYGWDWHPRLVPIGIYDDVDFFYQPITNVDDVDITYNITDSMDLLSAKAIVKISNPVGHLIFEIIDEAGNFVVRQKTEAISYLEYDFIIENPKLWWCTSQGEQKFYYINTKIEIGDNTYECYKKRIGFRRIKLVMNENAWEKGPFPVTQGKPPITIELNGRKIFGKGTNFVPAEIFTSKLNSDIYRSLLTLVKDCNMNLIRLWGGGLVNKESFFDLCDELGIMVWQEFPLACNNYEDDPGYLKILDKESKSIIHRLKKHPSVVMWCGGNELLVSWGGMTNQSLALRLLDKNCFELDPHTPYIMSSPQYGMGHGYYLPITDENTEAISSIIDSDFTAYTEFGVPSPSPFGYIRSFTPPDELYNVEACTAWEHHHAVKAWDSRQNTWFCIDQINHYFGEETHLETLIENGMILQSEVYKHLFEESRRKWPNTSMGLNWCFNEPWPTAANNSVVNYPDIPKPGYYGVQSALRNQMLSARVYKMIWEKGETIKIEIFVLNDLPEAIPAIDYSVNISDSEGKMIKAWTDLVSPQLDHNSVRKINTLEFVVPEEITARFCLNIICKNNDMSSKYLLFNKL